MMKNYGIVIFLLVVFGCTNTSQKTENESDAIKDTRQKTYVPDDNFERKLRFLGYDSGELDDYVFTENIKKVTKLKLDEEDIKDLTGIEDFVALEELYCSINQLTSLDVSKNTALKKLWCYDNQLIRLDVSKNRDLVKLNCINNKLTSIDVSKNTALTFLGCDNNQLTHFDIPKNTDLLVSLDNTGIVEIRDFRNTESSKNGKTEYVFYENLPDSFKTMIETAKKFEVWYSNNDGKKIDQDKLVKYSDSLGYYIIDMNYGDYYLKTLKETDLVSDSLISQLHNAFLNSQVYYETNKLGPETDGPIGFEADLITNDQESLIPTKIEDISIGRITIFSNGSISCGWVQLINENGNWLVDR